MSSARFSGVMAIGVLFASACFHPNYDHPMCGPNGECPSGLKCSPQGICEDGAGVNQWDASLPDVSRICDPTGTFDPPVRLTGFNTMQIDGYPRLTADELELYFTRALGTSDPNIYIAQRSTTSQPFGAPIAVTQVNSVVQDSAASVSSDGLMLFFGSARVSGQGFHLYLSTRTSRVDQFDAPSKVANVNSATVTDSDGQPFVTADGQELWFASNRLVGGGNDIYRAVWNGSSFANVSEITAFSTNAEDWLPTLSADKLTVYLSSNRSGGKGSFDIWTAHRSKISDEFPAPTPVPELNSMGTEYLGWLSPDNCRLYFSSDVDGTQDIYVATRHLL